MYAGRWERFHLLFSKVIPYVFYQVCFQRKVLDLFSDTYVARHNRGFHRVKNWKVSIYICFSLFEWNFISVRIGRGIPSQCARHKPPKITFICVAPHLDYHIEHYYAGCHDLRQFLRRPYPTWLYQYPTSRHKNTEGYLHVFSNGFLWRGESFEISWHRSRDCYHENIPVWVNAIDTKVAKKYPSSINFLLKVR